MSSRRPGGQGKTPRWQPVDADTSEATCCDLVSRWLAVTTHITLLITLLTYSITTICHRYATNEPKYGVKCKTTPDTASGTHDGGYAPRHQKGKNVKFHFAFSAGKIALVTYNIRPPSMPHRRTQCRDSWQFAATYHPGTLAMFTTCTLLSRVENTVVPAGVLRLVFAPSLATPNGAT